MIAQLSWWQIAIDLLILTFCIIMIIWALKKSNSVFKLKDLSGRELSIGSESKKDTILMEESSENIKDAYMKESSHLDNKLSEDSSTYKNFIIIIRKSILFGNKQTEILNVSTIRDQMNSAQLKITQIKGIYTRIFTELILEKLGSESGLLYNTSYIIFMSILHDYLDETILKLKSSFIINHFADRLEDDFEEIVEDQVLNLRNDWDTSFGLRYFSLLSPSQEEFKKAIKKVDDLKISDLLRDCFVNAKSIAVKSKEMMKLMEDTFELDCQKLINSEKPIKIS